MQHAHGQLLATHRAGVLDPPGLGRGEPDLTVAVPVEVILALLGKELDGVEKPGWIMAGKRSEHASVARLTIQYIGLACQLARGVGV